MLFLCVYDMLRWFSVLRMFCHLNRLFCFWVGSLVLFGLILCYGLFDLEWLYVVRTDFGLLFGVMILVCIYYATTNVKKLCY